MERLTNKREADAQREGYERRLANGYQRSSPQSGFIALLPMRTRVWNRRK